MAHSNQCLRYIGDTKDIEVVSFRLGGEKLMEDWKFKQHKTSTKPTVFTVTIQGTKAKLEINDPTMEPQVIENIKLKTGPGSSDTAKLVLWIT